MLKFRQELWLVAVAALLQIFQFMCYCYHERLHVKMFGMRIFQVCLNGMKLISFKRARQEINRNVNFLMIGQTAMVILAKEIWLRSYKQRVQRAYSKLRNICENVLENVSQKISEIRTFFQSSLLIVINDQNYTLRFTLQ